jgi:hypothetical protein
MENINGKSRASFRRTFSCATMGLAVSASLCFAQGNRDAWLELQRAQAMQYLGTAPPEITTPFLCDSRVPEVCLDIYRRRVERAPKRILNESPFNAAHIRVAPIPTDIDKPCGTRLPESACSAR